MESVLVTQILAILFQALKLLVLVAILVGSKFAVSFLKAKVNVLESKLNSEDKAKLDELAKDTYLVVEQLSKNGEVKNKVDAFNKELRDKAPELASDEIDRLRELACGFFNTTLPKK